MSTQFLTTPTPVAIDKSYNAEHRTSTTGSIVKYKYKQPLFESTSQRENQQRKTKKYALERPKRMKANVTSYTLQISLCITGAVVSLIYALARDVIGVYYPTVFLWLTVATIFAYYEVDFSSFKLCIANFRGLIIFIAVFLSVICDFIRHFLTKEKELFFTILIGNMAWIYGILYMIFLTDSAPRIMNFLRFVGPCLILLQTLWFIIDDFFWKPDDDFNLFDFYKGSVTVNEVQLWCKMQILWFGSSLVLSVMRDSKHEFFVLMDDRVLTKVLLPYRNISTDVTTFFYSKISIPTVHMFSIIAVIGSVYGAIYLFVLSYKNYISSSDISIIISIASCVLLGIMLYIIFGILVVKYFQLFMVKTLLFNFRASILLVCIVILFYVPIQKILWEKDIDAIFIIWTIINYFVFILSIFALWARDGFHILYPNYFIAYVGVLISLLSVWNIFLLTFDESGNDYPSWFIILEKQAYFQVIVSWVLCFYYWSRDRNSHYFVWIRQRRETIQQWNDPPPERYQSITEYDIDASSYVNRSRRPSQIDTLNSAIIDGSDGNDNL